MYTDYTYLVKKAREIIQKHFADKTDLSGEPYIKHLENVAMHFDWKELQVVALLHDLLEDCPEYTANMLRDDFPENIVQSIIALTHKSGQSYDDYISQVIKNDMARQVKFIDLKHNMDISRLKELTEKDIQRLKKYHKSYRRLISEGER